MERTTEQGVLHASSGGTEVEDATFIRAAQAEPEAFGLIYQRYVDRVYAYMRTRLASEHDAADLTQQVFIRAFQGLPKYRSGRAPFAAWLFRIAANAATDEFRRKRAPALALQFLPESLSPATASAIEPEESGRLELLREQRPLDRGLAAEQNGVAINALAGDAIQPLGDVEAFDLERRFSSGDRF